MFFAINKSERYLIWRSQYTETLLFAIGHFYLSKRFAFHHLSAFLFLQFSCRNKIYVLFRYLSWFISCFVSLSCSSLHLDLLFLSLQILHFKIRYQNLLYLKFHIFVPFMRNNHLFISYGKLLRNKKNSNSTLLSYLIKFELLYVTHYISLTKL